MFTDCQIAADPGTWDVVFKQKETEGYSVYQVEEDKLDLILTDAEETSYPEGYMDGVQEKEGFAYVILIQQ